MPEHALWFTALLNKLFAGPAAALLAVLGIRVEDPAHPIPNYMAMQILVALIIMAVFLILRPRLSMERPGRIQHSFEVFFEFIGQQAEEIVGHHGHRFVPMVMTIGVFILFSNLIGLIPTFESPTMHIEVTVGCALVVFVYYHYSGARHQGVLKYLKHFGGPVLALSPLMFVVEIVSHLARPLSLSVRLFANIFAGEQITVIFLSLVPLGVPMVFMGLHTFVAFLQAYIFMLLTLVYLAGAVAEEH